MTSGGFRPDGLIGFPLPTRPDNSYSPRVAEIPYPAPLNQSPVTAYPVGYPVPPSCGRGVDREDGERETIEELKRGIMELYEKLPAAVRSQVNLEKFHIPNNVVTSLKVDAAQSREVQGIVDQLSPKLERFKVRSVKSGIVIKTEEDGKKE